MVSAKGPAKRSENPVVVSSCSHIPASTDMSASIPSTMPARGTCKKSSPFYVQFAIDYGQTKIVAACQVVSKDAKAMDPSKTRVLDLQGFGTQNPQILGFVAEAGGEFNFYWGHMFRRKQDEAVLASRRSFGFNSLKPAIWQGPEQEESRKDIHSLLARFHEVCDAFTDVQTVEDLLALHLRGIREACEAAIVSAFAGTAHARDIATMKHHFFFTVPEATRQEANFLLVAAIVEAGFPPIRLLSEAECAVTNALNKTLKRYPIDANDWKVRISMACEYEHRLTCYLYWNSRTIKWAFAILVEKQSTSLPTFFHAVIWKALPLI